MEDLAYTCPLCNYALATEGLCRKCHSRLHRQLDDLFELWSDAHSELLPGKGGHGSASSEQTIGLNVAALSFIAGDDILGFCHEWEKLIREDRGLTKPALLRKHDLATEIAETIKFHQAHLEWSGTQPWIGDFASELRKLHGQGLAAARRFVERVRRIPCPSETSDGLPCHNLLKIRDEDLLAIFECRKCGSEWTTVRLISVALSSPTGQFWVDAEAIAKWIGISERQVRKDAAFYEVPKKGEFIDFKALIQARQNKLAK